MEGLNIERLVAHSALQNMTSFLSMNSRNGGSEKKSTNPWRIARGRFIDDVQRIGIRGGKS